MMHEAGSKLSSGRLLASAGKGLGLMALLSRTVGGLLETVSAADREAGDELGNGWRFEQMYLTEFAAECNELPKRRGVLWVRNTRKVDL